MAEKETFTMFSDNMSAISITKKPVFHGRTKHIEFKHHYIRVNGGAINMNISQLIVKK